MLSSMVYGNPQVGNMMLKICFLLLSLLACGQSSDLRQKSFIRISEERSWTDAQTHCRRRYTDLVTIRDETENLLSINGWIGLYKDSDSQWKWSRGNEIANFTMWDGNGPNPDDNCAFRRWGYRPWYSRRCDYSRTYTCYHEYLLLVKERKTWEKALKHCRGLEAVDQSRPAGINRNHRYDLATLLTEDDHTFAQEKTQLAKEDEVWTGLRYLAGQWFWVGGEGVQYTDIESCTAEDRSGRQSFCGVLLKNRTIVMRDCNIRKSFLCYRKG